MNLICMEIIIMETQLIILLKNLKIMEKQSIYDTVTNRIIEKLESGCIPWIKPWHTENTLDKNPSNSFIVINLTQTKSKVNLTNEISEKLWIESKKLCGIN